MMGEWNIDEVAIAAVEISKPQRTTVTRVTR
jgi:hypothetical protein